MDVSICRRCILHRSRRNAVFGEGNYRADVMLVGEAPGYNEDLEGHPFVGAAGRFLNELLLLAGLERSSVFITNVVKCRPPANRQPTSDEIAACGPYLDAQIELISPRFLVTLGNVSTAVIFGKFGLTAQSMGKIHAKTFDVKTSRGMLYLIAMYHPATALYRQPMREIILEDWLKLKQIIGR